MIKSALTPDNSKVSIIYLDRPDVTVPIIASNKGARPGVIASKAGLVISLNDGSKTHALLLTATEQSRNDLLIPENTSKQFFYQMDFQQPNPNTFSELAADFKQHPVLSKCVFIVSHLDFQGNTNRTELVLYDAMNPKWRDDRDDVKLEKILAAMECMVKIPQPIRQHYKVFGE